MKPLAFALASLPLILATALPVSATETASPQVSVSRGKVVLALDQDGIADTFAFDELAVGESRQIVGKNGKIVTVTRATDALTIEADGKTTRIEPPGPGDTRSRIKVLRTGEDGEERRIVMLHGTGALNIADDLVLLDGTLDDLDLDIDIEKALADARVALDSVDRTVLVQSLDKARAHLDAIDIDAIVADAKANGGKVLVIRRKSQEPATTAD